MEFKIIRIRRFLFGAIARLANYWPLALVAIFLCTLGYFAFKADGLITATGLKTKQLTNFFSDPATVFDNTNGRTNFLILGIRGFGDQGEDLTDTMMLISYQYSTHSISIVSIPRDIWVNSLKTKINAVYHYGKFRADDGGIKLTQAAILETLGLPVHYTVVVDFSIFKELVDLVGGVDVNVVNSFVDNKFPIQGMETALPISSRYETVSFEKGPQHFDGPTALKFVRSRYAEGPEGTDTARNDRQQLVVTALRQKLTNPRFFLNKDNVTKLFSILHQSTQTNLTTNLYPALARIFVDSRRGNINRIDLPFESSDNQSVVILENPPAVNYQGQWVLIAKDNNWKALQQYLQNRLDGKQ